MEYVIGIIFMMLADGTSGHTTANFPDVATCEGASKAFVDAMKLEAPPATEFRWECVETEKMGRSLS